MVLTHIYPPSEIFSGFLKRRFEPRDRSLKICKYLIKHLDHSGTIMISIWWSLDFFTIPHFLTRSTFTILTHEVPLIFFLMKIGDIFIIHHKIRIFHIVFWNKITITITIYDIWNLYCFIIIRCSSIKSTCILNLSKYHRNQYWSSATSCGASITT